MYKTNTSIYKLHNIHISDINMMFYRNLTERKHDRISLSDLVFRSKPSQMHIYQIRL